MATNTFGPLFPPRSTLYGSFSYDQDKALDGANTPTVIPLNTVESSNGIRLENSSQVVAPVSGIYKYEYSLQLDKNSGGVSTVDIWLRINGSDAPRSGGQVSLQGQQGEIFPFVSYNLELNRNDYVELVFASSDSSVFALHVDEWITPTNPYNRPAIPSLIVNMILLQ